MNRTLPAVLFLVANALAASVKMAQNSPPVPKPAPTPTPQSPTAPTPSASCPAWYQRPEPGKGVGYCSAQGKSGFVVCPMQPPPGC